MLSIEKLKEAGADTETGIARCAGSEEFYLKIADMVISSEHYEELRDSVEAGDLDTAFEKAHALKGIVANASLDRLLKPVAEITELLRNRTETDYSPYIDEIMAEIGVLRELRDSAD